MQLNYRTAKNAAALFLLQARRMQTGCRSIENEMKRADRAKKTIKNVVFAQRVSLMDHICKYIDTEP